MDPKNMIAVGNQQSISNLDELFDVVQTWKLLCKDALHGIEASCKSNAGKPVDAETAKQLDTAYIFAERTLSEWLRHDDPKRYLLWRKANENLWHGLFGNETCTGKSIIKLFKIYHHFFKDFAGHHAEEVRLAVAVRMKYLDEQAKLGDKHTANLGSEIAMPTNIIRFRRLLLLRKLLFISQLESKYWLGFTSSKTKLRYDDGLVNLNFTNIYGDNLASQLFAFVALHQDYEYDHLNSFFARANEMIQLQAAPMRMARASDGGLDEYVSFRDLLKECDLSIDQLGKKDLSEWKDAKVMSRYHELVKKREVIAWAMNQHHQELGLKDKVKVGWEEYQFKSKLGAKTFLMDAGLLLAKSTGKNLAKAIWNQMNNKEAENNWGEIGKEALFDLAQIGTMALVSVFFGPGAGGSAASMLGGILRPSPPDPYLEEFKKLHKGIQEILTSIDKMQASLEKLIQALPAEISKKLMEINFNNSLMAFRNELKNVESVHAEMLKGEKRKLLDAGWLTRHELLATELQAILSLLWNKNFKLTTTWAENPDWKMDLTEGTIIHFMIKTFSEPKSFRRFHESVQSIYQIVDSMEQVVAHYQSAMPALRAIYAMEIAIVEDCKREDFFAALLQIQKQEKSYSHLLLMAVNEIRLSIGRENAILYHKMMRYWDDGRNLNLFSGFMLQESKIGETQATQQQKSYLCFDYKINDIGTEKWCFVNIDNGSLYILPHSADDSQSNDIKGSYKVVSPFKNHDHHARDLKLALGLDNTVITESINGLTRCNVVFMEDVDQRSLDHAAHYGIVSQIGSKVETGKLPKVKDLNTNLEFFKNETEFGLTIFSVGQLIYLLREPVAKYRDEFDNGNMHCIARTDAKGVFEIGFGKQEKVNGKLSIKTVVSIRLDPSSIYNLIPETGHFDYDISNECLKSQEIEHFLMPNFALFQLKSSLFPGQSLQKGTSLYSYGKKVTYQTDGNLVSFSNSSTPTWDSGTSGKPSSILKMQHDGNLVIYKAPGPNESYVPIAVWAASWYKCKEHPSTEFKDFQMNVGKVFNASAIRNENGIPIWSADKGRLKQIRF
jgi:hypothetical protein